MGFPLIGSVSHGTMRNEDLIPVFADTLESLLKNKSDEGSGVWGSCRDLIAAAREIEDFGSENADEVLNDLFGALDCFAPPFFYFGSNLGDGSDFGFWFSSEAFEDAVHAGEVFKIAAGNEWPDDFGASEYQYVAEITDHGNVTLFTVGGKEIWAIV
jgi:hypothetical protein